MRFLAFSEVVKSERFGAHAVAGLTGDSADIHNSGVHLLNLIKVQYSILSRIEVVGHGFNEEGVSLVHVVADCHHSAKPRATSRGIAIHEVFEQGMRRIWGDERAMRQIAPIRLAPILSKSTPPQGGDILW